MTIAAAWVRTLRNCKELIVVSDSRLNGGMKMDCGQKIITLPLSYVSQVILVGHIL